MGSLTRGPYIVLKASGALGIFVNSSSSISFLMAFLDWDMEAAWATVLLITADSWLLSCQCVLKTWHENTELEQLFLPSCLLV